MRATRQYGLVAVLGCWLAAAVIAASPARADVDCADLGSKAEAQAYADGRAGDPDHLDADHDGRACEGNGGTSLAAWALLGLGVALAGGLVRYGRPARTGHDGASTTAEEAEVREPVAISAAPPLLVQASGPPAVRVVRRREVVASAATGTTGELARALRLVPYGERMSLLEEHARSHGVPPQQVLDELAGSISDLELQGWALAGYDPPWTVRVMRCSCVDGVRNFRLQTAEDGSHFWACASCHQPDRHLS